MNLDFSNKTIGCIEATDENINNLEIKLTETQLSISISFNNNKQEITKEIKKENNDIIDFIELEEEQKEVIINIEDYKTIFFTEFLNKNYNIYKFLVSNERKLKNYFDYINSLNELDKKLFMYLLDQESYVINQIKDNILFDFAELTIKAFIEEFNQN